MRVVMLHILAQHCGEVAWSGDQDVVEAFAAQSADEAFRDRVRPAVPGLTTRWDVGQPGDG
jgi:hypothetical protein